MFHTTALKQSQEVSLYQLALILKLAIVLHITPGKTKAFKARWYQPSETLHISNIFLDILT